jgi:NADPH-dependent 2,4-dienoyl-CoA reductase/sulfur reductase-like enzyme
MVSEPPTDTANSLNQKITAVGRGMNGKRVLVVGGGIAGMSFALRMRRYGWAVDLVESDPDWRVYGAGISITGPTFRAVSSHVSFRRASRAFVKQ